MQGLSPALINYISYLYITFIIHQPLISQAVFFRAEFELLHTDSGPTQKHATPVKKDVRTDTVSTY